MNNTAHTALKSLMAMKKTNLLPLNLNQALQVMSDIYTHQVKQQVYDVFELPTDGCRVCTVIVA